MESVQSEDFEDLCDDNKRETFNFTEFRESSSEKCDQTKCGEILINKRENFTFLCTFCGTLLEDIITFTEHVNVNHMNEYKKQKLQDILEEQEIKIELDFDDNIFVSNCMNLEEQSNPINFGNADHNENIRENIIKKEITIQSPDPLNSQKLKTKPTNVGKKKERLFNCDKCDEKFYSERGLNIHLKYDHVPTNPLIPISINYSQTDLSNDESKEKRPIIIDHFTCRYCGRRFENRRERFEHECRHTGDKPFVCEICKRSFVKESQYNAHVSSHKNTTEGENVDHQENINENQSSDPFNNTELESIPTKKKRKRKKPERPFNCDKCDKTFVSKRGLNIHLKYDHVPTNPFIPIMIDNSQNDLLNDNIDGESEDKQSIQIDPFKCRYCGKQFKSRRTRFEHECKHTGDRPYVCEICKKCFTKKSTLSVHLFIHNERSFKCDLCDAKFHCHSTLTSHKRRHYDERPYKCSFCDKAFKYSAIKKTHERIHTGERPYQCTICGQGFLTSSKLGIHSRKHTGEKPYKCDQCDKAFTTNRLKKHHEILHTKEKPHVCDICNSRFRWPNDLKNHKKLHSDVAGYICNICGKGFKQNAGLYSHKKSHGEYVL